MSQPILGPYGISVGQWIIVIASFSLSLFGLIGQWYLLGFRQKLTEKWIDKHEKESERENVKRDAESALLREAVHSLEVTAKGQEERMRMMESLLQMFVATFKPVR